MKEATGELNMTVITVVAIAAVAALLYVFVWPTIQQAIATNTCKAAYGEEFTATKGNTVGDTKASNWTCTSGTTNNPMP